MDACDGEGNGYADGEEEVGEENAREDLPAGIPAIPPMDDVNHDTQNEDGEDTTENSSGVGGGGNVTPRSGVRQGNRSAEASIAGVKFVFLEVPGLLGLRRSHPTSLNSCNSC